ncbi:unnamed protein product, partial [Mesorhabditis spiculigera]
MASRIIRNGFRQSSRQFAFSAPSLGRFRSNPPAPVLREIGRMLKRTTAEEGGLYKVGQLFIHRAFAYRGIIVLASECPMEVNDRSGRRGHTEPFYQVLIHRGDWEHMGFPINITSYLGEGGSRQEKILTVIHGMDCVRHADLLPLVATDPRPIEHDLFDRIFECKRDPEAKQDEYKFALHPELEKHAIMNKDNKWLAPCQAYIEKTENIEVMVITFYLGTTMVGGHIKHLWRYVNRITNTTPKSPVILRERSVKVFSLNNMHHLNGIGVVGTPELGMNRPSFQFSSTVEFPHSKGGHLWGRFKMEREDRSVFDVAIPSVLLDSEARLPEPRIVTEEDT